MFIVIVYGGVRLQIVSSCASLHCVFLWMCIYLKLHYDISLTPTLTQITAGDQGRFAEDLQFVKTLAAVP